VPALVRIDPGTGKPDPRGWQSERGETGRKAAAVPKWEDLDPERLRYEMIFMATESIARDGLEPALRFIREGSA